MSSSNISSLSSTLNWIQQTSSLGFCLVFLTFGVVGCFLNILLFSRQQFRKISCCTYFLVSSIGMLSIVSVYGGTSLYTFYYGHPTNYSRAYCKAYNYIVHLLSIMFRWNLAAASLDRCALSSINARFRHFASMYIAHRVVITIGLISIVFPVHDFILYDLKASSCIIVYGYIASLYNGVFTIITASVIPISIMIICSFFIRRNLANKRERRQVNVGLQRKLDQQALVMLFTQIIVCIILTVPYTIDGIYNAISLNVPNKSADRLAIERFILFFTASVITLFPTSSFYLYTLTSRMYRKELFIMLRSILCFECFVKTDRIEPWITNT